MLKRNWMEDAERLLAGSPKRCIGKGMEKGGTNKAVNLKAKADAILAAKTTNRTRKQFRCIAYAARMRIWFTNVWISGELGYIESRILDLGSSSFELPKTNTANWLICWDPWRNLPKDSAQHKQLECIFLRPECKLPLPFLTYFHFTSRFLFRYHPSAFCHTLVKSGHTGNILQNILQQKYETSLGCDLIILLV